MENYTPNSHKYKEEQRTSAEENKKLEKIVTGKVTTKKKSGVAKFADIFIPEDVTNVRDYVMSDIVIPAVKKAITDIVDICLYGEPGHSKKSSSGGSRVSYNRYYDNRKDERSSYRTARTRNNYDFDDVVLSTRGEAEEVLDALDEALDKYKVVSVSDLYDLVGIDDCYTDRRYGWTDLHAARVVRVDDGYLLKLPRALPLD